MFTVDSNKRLFPKSQWQFSRNNFLGVILSIRIEKKKSHSTVHWQCHYKSIDSLLNLHFSRLSNRKKSKSSPNWLPFWVSSKKSQLQLISCLQPLFCSKWTNFSSQHFFIWQNLWFNFEITLPKNCTQTSIKSDNEKDEQDNNISNIFFKPC